MNVIVAKMTRNNKTPLNPFLLAGYLSLEYFCDREQETAKLASALKNGRNVTLTSPRRMGKTGLILHLFNRLEQEGIACYYVDLYQTDSLASLVEQLGNAVLGTLDSTEKKIVKKVGEFFKSLRPTINIDPQTGEPGFTVNVQPLQAEYSFQEILNYMEQADKPCIVAFDEFQTITEYADKKVEALLRSYIQRLNNVHFIFSGSQRHILINMFASATRPFYQSTQMMPLGIIDEDQYFQFANRHLCKNGQSIDEESFSYLYHVLHGHTWYIQSMLNRIYEYKTASINKETINKILSEIVEENEATYQTFLRLITPAQGKLIRAIARQGEVNEPTGQAFISKYNLGASSTVRSATKALVEKEMLLEDNGTYQVYDRYFGIWLRQHSL